MRGIAPGYEEKRFEAEDKRGRLRLVASPDGADGSVLIHQDARLYAGLFDGAETATLDLAPGRRAYVHVARGSVSVNGMALEAGDALKVSEETAVVLAGGARRRGAGVRPGLTHRQFVGCNRAKRITPFVVIGSRSRHATSWCNALALIAPYDASVRRLLRAMRTGHAILVYRRQLLARRDHGAAGVALHGAAWLRASGSARCGGRTRSSRRV